jgi:hypothetical protein
LYEVIWAFILKPTDETNTRVLVRSSGKYTSLAVGLYLRFVVRPIHFAMQRKQLLNLKQRIEAEVASSNHVSPNEAWPRSAATDTRPKVGCGR